MRSFFYCEIVLKVHQTALLYTTCRALSISKDKRFRAAFKKKPNSCFLNNYFDVDLKARQTSMSNHCKTVTYICPYFT